MKSIALASALALAACSGMTPATVIADGQLVCKVGTLFAAMAGPQGALFAKAASSAYVHAACAMVNGVPVALPPGVAPAAMVLPVAPPAL